MLKKELFGVTRQVLAGPAGRVELGEQCECLVPHRRLHQGRLAERGSAEDLKEPIGLGLDPALAAGARDGGPHPAPAKTGLTANPRRLLEAVVVPILVSIGSIAAARPGDLVACCA
ncbi:hypothetical protein Scani_82130 [Streptomyces caniferus]|uniref:Uncharacterized protein n=1 Tax=Streptomyces caniferus TaxID=285557 RepID=A0A640SR53_9ACTN|nr:hypothetical protein Scani_33570 [Streptomyces caniferus]GFE11896.1 hypothetical protein Scani_81640 [Streptomyces caniferus]GFE11934.1 hypothetical protein Scani_82020 [Streptomyces caniferus]GFE11945.1 hypothetical protein Scani_82130 [Streptomyces caniferus]